MHCSLQFCEFYEEATHRVVSERQETTSKKNDAKVLKIIQKTKRNAFSELFYLLHETGDKLYPVRMKNRDTGKYAFRVSKGGAGANTKSAGLEIEDEHEMVHYVFELGYAVRAATIDRSKGGLFKVGQRSIVRAVKQ